MALGYDLTKLAFVGLTDVGDFEYWKIRPVLLRVTSPEQLHEIEEVSPQIRGEDAELWRAFIARDIPDWSRKNYVPKNPLKWYEVYRKYIKEQNQEIDLDKARLIQAMQGLKKEKEAHLTEKVKDTSRLPKLPKDPGMMANNGGVPIGARKKGFARPTSVLSFASGSKTKITSPAALLIRARREAKEISSRNRLSQPTDQLKSRTRILQAPQGMVNEYRTASKQAIRIFTPRKKSGGGTADTGVPASKESDLRALVMKHTSEVGHYTLVSSDSDPNHSGSEEDDLFDSPVMEPAAPAKKLVSRKLSTPLRSKPFQVQPLKTSMPSASKPAPEVSLSDPGPSDFISSNISTLRSLQPEIDLRPKPQSQSDALSTRPDCKPGPSTISPKQTILMKRKASVDIFNRQKKR